MGFLNNLSNKFTDKLSDYLVNYLILNKQANSKTYIQESISEKEYQTLCKIVYRCMPSEMEQAMNQLALFDKTSFWRQSSKAKDIRKICSGAGALVVDTLTNICIDNYETTSIDNEEYDKLINEFIEDNDLINAMSDWLRWILVEGDGAIRIDFNGESPLPIFTYVEAIDVEFKYRGKRVEEILFKNYYKLNDKNLTLLSCYGKGYIKYKLFDEDKIEYSLDVLEETKGLKDVFFFNKDGSKNDLMLAIPCKIFDSNLFPGRGGSVFSNAKIQAIDMCDEAISSMVESSRLCLPKTYTPQSFLPKDKDGNIINTKNDFLNSFLTYDDSFIQNEDAKIGINVVQPDFKVDRYQDMLKQGLTMLCEGLISPYTIGLNREMANPITATEVLSHEKQTNYTCNIICNKLTYILKDLFYNSLKAYYLLNFNRDIDDLNKEDIAISFGNYAAPSFDRRLELCVQATQYNRQLMSWEMIVDTLYKPNDLTKEERELEIQRLKELNANIEKTSDTPLKEEEDIELNNINDDSNQKTNDNDSKKI